MEEILYNSYEKNIAVHGDFEMPVPTYDMEKRIDFSVIIALLLRSNSNPKQDNYRYIDYSKINRREICEECKISMRTLDTRLRYLEEKNIITAKNTSRGLAYIINHSKDEEPVVSIQHRILKALHSLFNKNIIKTYILLKMQCECLNNTRPMTNAFLCSQLGYATNNERNLTNIGQWTSALANCGFIEKIHNRIYVRNKEGKNVIERVDTYYKINTLEVWEKRSSKL